MYIKLPPDYVDPSTQTPLPDAALVIADVELRLRAGDVRITAAVYSSPDRIGVAQPIAERNLSALSPEEITQVTPDILETLYTVILGRPTYQGAELVGGEVTAPPSSGSYTATWAWDATSGAFHRTELRTDSKDWPAATRVTLSTFLVGGSGTKVDALLGLLKQGSRLQFQQAGEATVRALYAITTDAALGAEADSVDVAVTLVDGSGTTPADGKNVLVSVLT